jgi:hypothetical protein
MNLYFDQPCEYASIYDVVPPDISKDSSNYSMIVENYKMSFDERVILSLALVPNAAPQLLDTFFIKNANYDRGFSEFGGIKGQQHAGFLPTGETAVFILAADSLKNRFRVIEIFDANHFFNRYNILKLVNTQSNEPYLSGLLSLSTEHLNYLTSGETHKPDYNINFPARRLDTTMDWADLVLEDQTLQEVMEIRDWIEHGETLLNDWGMKKKIKPGFRSLFYGPHGTGKTLTASLLGKSTGLDVYCIDVSKLVSKYIGETEKNLSKIFDQSENKNWILFFDEADALFGKRTEASSSNDQYANQEISYLLQKIEDYPGVVILVSNLKANLDAAFTRRFQSIIHFPIPNSSHRLRLWQNAFPEKTVFSDDIKLEDIAQKYELTAGAINNITRYCSLMALKKGSNVILLNDVIEGLRREFRKDGKIVS